MVGACILTSSRGMKTVAPDSAMLGGSFAGRSGAAEAGEFGFAGVDFGSPALGFASAEPEMGRATVELGSAALEIGLAPPEIVSAPWELARAALEVDGAAIEMGCAPVGVGCAPVEMGVAAAAVAFSAAAAGAAAVPGAVPAGTGAVPAGAAGLPAASVSWGAASLPSAGLSALDLRNQSSMAGAEVAVLPQPITLPLGEGIRAGAAEGGGAPSDPRRTDALPRPAGEGRGEGEGVDCRGASEEKSETPHVVTYGGQKASLVPHESGGLEPA